MSLIKDKYITSLCYWREIFEKNNFDLVILVDLEHGLVFDSIPLGIARIYNIKSVVLERSIVSIKYNCSKYMIFNFNSREYLPVSNRKYSDDGSDDFSDKYLYRDLLSKNDNFLKLNSKRYNIISRGINFFFGVLGVFSAREYFLRKKNINNGIEYKSSELLRNYFYLYRMRKYYNDKISSYSPDLKYVYYPLHFVPDANIHVRTHFSNEIYNIRLSKYLPKGWVIYVKEHPHQFFNYNNSKRWYYLASALRFKTEYFYDIKNTKCFIVESKA